MQPYQNWSGKSNIDAFEIGDDFIKVAFSDGNVYSYNYDISGQDIVDEMKRLALSGSGLNGYINQNAKETYADTE